MWWRIRNFWWDLTNGVEDVGQLLKETGSGSWHFLKRVFLARKAIPVWMLLVTGISTAVGLAGLFQLIRANHVSEASVAQSERSFRDQMALGHPSISVVGGATLIAPRSSNPGFIQMGETGSTYAVQVTLRNSGARDAAPLWVAISEDKGSVNDFAGKRMIARLPKDDEQTLTFDLVEKPSQGNWEVAYAYLDEVPADQNEDPGSPSRLTFKCSGISFVQLDSRPKEGVTDSGLRILSAGSPFMMEPMTEGPHGPEAKTTAQGLRNELYALIWNEPACRPEQ